VHVYVKLRIRIYVKEHTHIHEKKTCKFVKGAYIYI